jgi:hypothetical protein
VSTKIGKRTRAVLEERGVVFDDDGVPYLRDCATKTMLRVDHLNLGPGKQAWGQTSYATGNIPCVWVIWDEDYDTRVLRFLDQLGTRDWGRWWCGLVAIYEHKGFVEMGWHAPAPWFLRTGRDIYVCGDLWQVKSYDLTRRRGGYCTVKRGTPDFPDCTLVREGESWISPDFGLQ